MAKKQIAVAPLFHYGATLGDLREKELPSGERTILEMFKQPELTPV